jgi:glutamyl-tRNA synthetase
VTDKPVRARFAPSPTGRLHLGGARTALYDYLLARATGGQFILRIEDTDQKRYKPESEAEIMEGLRWLGLEWDEGPDVGGPFGPYRQSERREIYQQYIQELVDRGHAYPCFCSPERLARLREEQRKNKQSLRYDGHCRNIPPEEAKARIAAGESYVIRFKMPYEGQVVCRDALRGEIVYDNANLDDAILVKSDGLPVYHLASMVDDHLMQITHVLRGSEWLPTFPLHVHIYQAFGWEQPEWVHLSVFLKPSGKGKMSKREAADLMKDGYSIFVTDLKEMGYLPEATINWIALMGWSYDDHTEFFTLDDLVQKFSIRKLNPAPAAINFAKFDHFNGLHIRALPPEELARRVKPFFEKAGYQVDDAKLMQLIPVLQPRLTTLDDAAEVAGFFFEDHAEPDPQRLVGKLTPQQALDALRRARDLLARLPDWRQETADAPLRDLAGELGIKAGALFGLLREAVTGRPVSPPIYDTMMILGRETVFKRLAYAEEILSRLAA